MRKTTVRKKRTTHRHQLKRLLTSRKATSMGIVALLLVLVTLVSGFFFYDYIVGHMGVMQDNFQEQMELLFLKSFRINATHIISFIGNKGIWAINIVSAYINNRVASILQNVQIDKNAVEPVHILGTFAKGLTYTVQLGTNFGSSLNFDVTYV